MLAVECLPLHAPTESPGRFEGEISVLIGEPGDGRCGGRLQARDGKVGVSEKRAGCCQFLGGGRGAVPKREQHQLPVSCARGKLSAGPGQHAIRVAEGFRASRGNRAAVKGET